MGVVKSRPANRIHRSLRHKGLVIAIPSGPEAPPFTPRKSWRKVRKRAMDSLAHHHAIMTNRNSSQLPPGSSALHDKTHDKFFPNVTSPCKTSTGNILQTPLIPRDLRTHAKSGHGLPACAPAFPKHYFSFIVALSPSTRYLLLLFGIAVTRLTGWKPVSLSTGSRPFPHRIRLSEASDGPPAGQRFGVRRYSAALGVKFENNGPVRMSKGLVDTPLGKGG